MNPMVAPCNIPNGAKVEIFDLHGPNSRIVAVRDEHGALLWHETRLFSRGPAGDGSELYMYDQTSGKICAVGTVITSVRDGDVSLGSHEV